MTSAKRLSTFSAGEFGDSRPLSPDACNRSIKSSSSTSTLDSIALESNVHSAPPLPARVDVRVLELRKWSRDSAAPGWGVTLRGTTSELAKGVKIYNCYVETVHDNGAAKGAGLKEGDQIVCVDGNQVKNKEHKDIVKIFQTQETVILQVIPAKFKSSSQVRIIKSNSVVLEYVWALMRHLQALEIININLGKSYSKLDLSSLISLRSLSMNHCSLEHLEGFDYLLTLESLSLAHNLLTSEAVSLSKICTLKKLKKLDLSRNVLIYIPECVCSLNNLEILILVDNNITEIPQYFNQLENLHTLCLDGNLLKEVDPELRLMKSIEKLTISNNSLECESEVVKLNEFLITCIEGNPFCMSSSLGISRNEPSLRRTLSVRGQLLSSKHRRSLEWDSCLSNLKLTDYNDYADQTQ